MFIRANGLMNSRNMPEISFSKVIYTDNCLGQKVIGFSSITIVLLEDIVEHCAVIFQESICRTDGISTREFLHLTHMLGHMLLAPP